MSEEAAITQAVEERPGLDTGALRKIRPKMLFYRFIAGALTSLAAGLLALAFGVRAGGVMLAFPAILAASLTLIEEQEDSAEAREDARGAVVGAGALGLFAAVAALCLGAMAGAIALALATVAWFAAAFLGYAVAWLRPGGG